jgi:Ca-activated chloride channel family protein
VEAEEACGRWQDQIETSRWLKPDATYYFLGRGSSLGTVHEARLLWEEAVKSYDTGLQIKADDADAKHNRDFVKRKIEQLKKQEEQKKQDQQKQQDQKNQQQNKDQKNNDQQNQSQNQKSNSKNQ